MVKMSLFGIRLVIVILFISLLETDMAESASTSMRRLQTKVDIFIDTVLEMKQSLQDLRDDVSLLQNTTCDPALGKTSQQVDLHDVSEILGSFEAAIGEVEARMTKGFQEEKMEARKRFEDHEKGVDRLTKKVGRIENDFEENCKDTLNEAVEQITHVNATLYEFKEERYDEFKNDYENVNKYTTDRIDRLSEDLDKAKSELTKVTNGQQEIIDLEHSVLTKIWRLMYGSDIQKHGTSLYILFSEPMTWKPSQQKCQEIMSHLAEINDEDEHKFVRKMVGDKFVWLGATDEGNEGIWKWFTSGLDIPVSLWGKGEPNNGGTEEHCLESRGHGMNDFNDSRCHREKYAVCEFEL